MKHDPWNFVFIVLAAIACVGWVVTTGIMFERAWKRAVENFMLKKRIEELEEQLASYVKSPGVSLPTLDYPSRMERHE